MRSGWTASVAEPGTISGGTMRSGRRIFPERNIVLLEFETQVRRRSWLSRLIPTRADAGSSRRDQQLRSCPELLFPEESPSARAGTRPLRSSPRRAMSGAAATVWLHDRTAGDRSGERITDRRGDVRARLRDRGRFDRRRSGTPVRRYRIATRLRRVGRILPENPKDRKPHVSIRDEIIGRR